jgi:hypothetical protein
MIPGGPMRTPDDRRVSGNAGVGCGVVIGMKRSLIPLLVLLMFAVAPAAAKEGAQAHLLTPLPSSPVPGALVSVRWTVDVPGVNGQRVPFGAQGMFVRLLGRGGASTTATAQQTHGPPYGVRIRVPPGGIRAIRFGLHGTNSLHQTANTFFPLTGNAVYFVQGYISPQGWRGHLKAIERAGTVTPTTALQVLLRGPSPGEDRRGLISAIPMGTQLQHLSLAAGTATVQLRTPAAGAGPPTAPTWARLGGDDFYGTAQIVYTLTAFHSIRRVALFVNGRHCCIWTMQNQLVRKPLPRSTFADWQGAPTTP